MMLLLSRNGIKTKNNDPNTFDNTSSIIGSIWIIIANHYISINHFILVFVSISMFSVLLVTWRATGPYLVLVLL